MKPFAEIHKTDLVLLRSMPLAKAKGPQLPSNGWKWRDAQGQFHAPADMVTRHLFHTVRMIWNHTVPPHMRTGPHRRHDFGPFYTKHYMAEAVRRMMPILLARDDIEPAWKRDIDWMRGWAQRQEPEEIFRIPEPQLQLPRP